MLNSISWGQFVSVILPMAIFYYLYVLVRFFRHELVAFFSGSKGKKPEQAGEGRQLPATGGDKPNGFGAPGMLVVSDPGQPELFNQPEGGIPDATPEMFKVMEKVVTTLKSVIAQGVAVGISREELLIQIEEVLGRYQQIKDTPYQGAVNSFLVRTCASNFSLALEEGDLAALWN